MEYKILVLNFGSTTSKISLYKNNREFASECYTHSKQELQGCENMLDQLQIRSAALEKFMEEQGLSRSDIDIVVPRYPIYKSKYPGHVMVNNVFMDMAISRKDAFHIMFIAPIVARNVLGSEVPMAICDIMSYRDIAPELEITGVPQIRHSHRAHFENCIAVSRKLAEASGKKTDELSFVYGHLGGGVSFSWFNKGKVRFGMFDGEACFSPERGGVLPSLELIDLCYSGEYTKAQAVSLIKGNGGLTAYFNTTDCLEIERRIREGDELARQVYTAMGIRMAGCIGEVSAIAKGGVDQIILAGGIAQSEYITGIIKEHVSYIAPVVLYPGEFEMEFFAGFGLDVLTGVEKPLAYETP